MSIYCTGSFIKQLFDLAADERPLLKICIMPTHHVPGKQVSRWAQLEFSRSWRCTDCPADDSTSTHTFGALIAGNEYVVILEGPVGAKRGPSYLDLSWRNEKGVMEFNDIEMNDQG